MLENSENIQLYSHTLKAQKDDIKHQQYPKSFNTLSPSRPNNQKRVTKKLGKYQFSMEQVLGSGMSGDAYVGYDTQTLELVCVKVVDRSVYKTIEEKRLLENEIRCQNACSSEFTIKIKDIFETPNFCFIITEFCQGGDLYRLLKSSLEGLPEELVKVFAKQIGCALSKLKQVGIIHRDIKSQNILLKQGQCKLGDFGFAIEKQKLTQKQFNLGSPLYMSLEALERSEYSFASDIFAFGVVLYEMLHKQSPWECSTQEELIKRMKIEEPAIKNGVSQDLKTLILSCLKQKPQQRPKIEDILGHPSLSQIVQTAPACY